MVHDIGKVALCGYVHPIVDTVTSHFLANEPIVPFKSRLMLFFYCVCISVCVCMCVCVRVCVCVCVRACLQKSP